MEYIVNLNIQCIPFFTIYLAQVILDANQHHPVKLSSCTTIIQSDIEIWKK